MDLQTTVLLSVLLLVLSLFRASASPLPGSFISRLRRSDGETVATTSAPEDVRQWHYSHLYAHVIDLAQLHSDLYTSFKEERYPGNDDPYVHDIVLSYLPTDRSIPSHRIRSGLSAIELIDLHYLNLIIFKDTLIRVRDTETGNVTSQVNTIVGQLEMIRVRLETLMLSIGHEEDIVRVPTNIPQFHANVTMEEHNTRTLLVFQEFDLYLPHVVLDYETLKG